MTAKINNDVYEEFSDTWWDENKFLHLLKVMVNPWRVPYFRKALADKYGQDLTHVRLLDIGSGGGVLAEEFASMGCRVTGIDISPRSIAVAQAHAAMSGYSIDYRVGSATGLPFDDESFDVVSCCDVLEHIAGWQKVISEVSRVLTPGGLFFFDTINRTPQSRLNFILGLQVLPLTKLMPPDTHVWEMFITPGELAAAAQQHRLTIQEMKGGKIATNPFSTLWNIQLLKVGRINFAELGERLKLKMDTDLSLNYLGYARKQDAFR